jgi:hypothetical protein
MGPRCSSAETQVCHRSYIIAASLPPPAIPNHIIWPVSRRAYKNDSLLYLVPNKVQVYLIQVHTRGHLKSELK